jgi:hypothetical protein
MKGAVNEDERAGRDDTADVEASHKGQMCLLRGYGLRRCRCRCVLAKLHGGRLERLTGRCSAVPSAVYCTTGLQDAFAWNQSCEMIDHII